MTTPSSDRPIVVLGAAGTGLLIADSIRRIEGVGLHGFLDDDAKKRAEGYEGLPVLGGLGEWVDLPSECTFISSLYGARTNPALCARVGGLGIPDERWATVIDPSAVVCGDVELGPGAYIGPATVVESMVRLGRRCALLGSVYVAHHCRLAEYTACANSASIAGGVDVGRAAFIGANAAVREYVTIGAESVIGMGSVVVRDVPDRQVVVGNPARRLDASRPSA